MMLSQMSENQSGIIVDIDFSDSSRRRLFDMGFISGQRVRCVNIGLMKTPIAYQIRGSKIALRKSDAKRIEVTPC